MSNYIDELKQGDTFDLWHGNYKNGLWHATVIRVTEKAVFLHLEHGHYINTFATAWFPKSLIKDKKHFLQIPYWFKFDKERAHPVASVYFKNTRKTR